MKKLSEKSINTIKSSASLITQNDRLITTRMYEILFDAHPELKALFANAPEDQYMKLADALSMYAVNIEKLNVLEPALLMIAQAHVREGVLPKHYPLVGSALMEAMEGVLKEEATIELIDAWREAYIHIGDILIEMEKDLYKKTQE